jgi:hypothetical protein
MKIVKNTTLFCALVSFLPIILSLWLYFLAPHRGSFSTTYNDYIIFKQSFPHLLQHKDLYVLYTNEYGDLFKYSPTFALLMAPFAYLPNLIGLILWNVLNFLVLFLAFRNFPFQTEKKTLWAMAFISIEALTSIIFTQSNCIIAALMIITYECLEKKKIVLATFLVALSVFIKPFGIVSFLLFLFYPGKIKAFSYSLLWFVLLFLLPLVVISPDGLLGEYKSWLLLLKNDHDNSFGISLFGLLHSWFGATDKNLILAAGTVVLVLPMLRYKAFIHRTFRSLFLASTLIWVIIFNHKGETPGFIIAVCGVAIWFFSQKFNKLNLALLLMVLFFTVLEPTDLFPKFLRDKFFTPYFICVVPCVLVWVKINWELLTKDFSVKGILPSESTD